MAWLSLAKLQFPCGVVPKGQRDTENVLWLQKVQLGHPYWCLPNSPVEELYWQGGGKSRYITKIDLLEGHSQVLLTERAKEVSPFVVQDALFACKVMLYWIKKKLSGYFSATDE